MTTLVCVNLIVILMMFVGLSSAKIDQKSIVGVWLFDEGKGDTASDSSGNRHDGEIGNGIKWSAVVIVPHEASLNLITWTVTAWIKAEFKNGWVEFVSKSVPVGNTDFRNYVLR